MDEWRLVINEPMDGAMNMAVDEAVLTSVSRGLAPPTIRFYRWSPPAVSLGYFQSLQKELDLAACRKADVDVVRRLTGGRAVLHQYELTYSIVVPEDNAKVAGSILEAYLAISGGLVEGLAELGITAELAAGTKPGAVASAVCFEAPSMYELVVGGKKLVGSAQTRRSGCLLQHGSILIELDPDLLFSIFNYDTEESRNQAKKLFLAKATCIKDILGYTPDPARLIACFTNGFSRGLGIRLREQQLAAAELTLARELSSGKYQTEAWNGRK